MDAITPSPSQDPIAGVIDWNNPSDFAYGLSLSLYEEDRTSTRRVAGRLMGDPIADVFGLVVRGNNSILAVADGSGWGKKARLAARCAVHAAITHITENMDKLTAKKPTSDILSKLLYDAIDVAQNSILQHGGALTTLSVAVTCQMDSPKSNDWGLFTASVGDSPICVYCPHSQSIFDVTIGGHAKDGGRNVQQSGGALGPAIGMLPDLENLILSYSPVYSGDIVILMTDGVIDNFAPKVMTALNEERKALTTNDDGDSGVGNSPSLPHSLPSTPETQRHKVASSTSPLVTRSASPCMAHPLRGSPHLNTVSYLWRNYSSCNNSPTTSPLIQHRTLFQEESADDASTGQSGEFGDSFQLMGLMECCEPIHQMGQFLKYHQNELLFDHISAQTVASATMNTIVEATESKRQFRVGCVEKGIEIYHKRKTDPEFAKLLSQYTSKLDHATIVTYTVGQH